MKTIDKVLFFLITVCLFGQCRKEANPVFIPDMFFLNSLIEWGVDTNGDGIIAYIEAGVIIYLDLRGDSIADLTGIEAFVNLDTLDCSRNQLSSLDFSNITALVNLNCSSNQITSLDISNNTAIKTLCCYDNQLTSLDVSNNTALQDISIKDMPLLTRVCVWELPFPPAGIKIDTTGSPSVYFTTDCNHTLTLYTSEPQFQIP